MTTSETLIAAKRELARRGWWQKRKDENFVSSDRVCAAQAIRAAARHGDNGVEFLAVAHFYLRVATGQSCGLLDDLFHWNDHPTRTLQDVLDAFDAAIEIAKAQEAQAAACGEPETVSC